MIDHVVKGSANIAHTGFGNYQFCMQLPFLLNEKCYLSITCINIQAFEGQYEAHEGDYLLP